MSISQQYPVFNSNFPNPNDISPNESPTWGMAGEVLNGEISHESDPEHTYVLEKEGEFTFTVTLEAIGPGGSDEETKVDFVKTPYCAW